MDNRKVIKLQDLSFYPDKTSSKYKDSLHIRWDRTGGKGPLVFFTDLCLPMAESNIYDKSFKVAFLLEPPVINSGTYTYAYQNQDKFDLILSHNQDFVDKLGNKAKYYENGMSWVDESDWKKYDKPKNISVVASNKNYAPGHKLRHEFIKKVKPGVLDLYGSGYKTVDHKIEALRDYKYSVAIENCRYKYYFTEKLIDCFLTHTIPIYWGSPDIEKFFDPNGMLIATNLQELISLTERVARNPDQMYNHRLTQEAMDKNFELAKKYSVAEDRIYEDILVPMGIV